MGLIKFSEAHNKVMARRMRTNDGKYTTKELAGKVHQIVYVTNAKNKNGLYRFIINSFNETGLVNTYNALGEYRWNSMIRQMVNHELLEAAW